MATLEEPKFLAIHVFPVLGLVTMLPISTLGVTPADATDGTEVPLSLAATTVNVYDVELVKPVTVSGEFAPVAVKPPGEEVVVYPVMACPPLEDGVVKVIVANASPAVATTLVGGSGRVPNAVPPIKFVQVAPL